MGDIDAIEDAVEFGIAKRLLEFGVGRGFLGKEFFGVIASFLAALSVVGFKARGGTSERAREGIGNSAKIGRFEIVIIIAKGGVETGGAIVDLVDVFLSIGLGEIDNESDDADNSESDQATEENFGNEAGLGSGGLAGDWTRGLRDMIEILKIIHKPIISEYGWDAKKV